MASDKAAEQIARLDSILSGSNPQPEKTTSVLSVFSSAISSIPPPPPQTLIKMTIHLVTSSSTPLVVGRSALGSIVIAFCGGSGLAQKTYLKSVAEGKEASEDEVKWEKLGKDGFVGDEGRERRMEVVKGVIDGCSAVNWCEEQISTLKHLLSHLHEQEEDWYAAARVLMGITLEGQGRVISDQDKLDVYMKIVRLLLETGESGQAQSYFSRASLLIHTTQDKETRLSFKLSQARLMDFSRKFNEAAAKYHELSFQQEIDEDERIYMLSAAVTCAILGPAGPQRSRILSNLYRDDRTTTSLPPFMSSILRKMFLDQILRVSEIQEFEKGLAEHQLAKLSVDRRMEVKDEEGQKGRKGPETVLDRAVMEHNVLACAKVYDNIRFDGLGALLDLTPNAAETMARIMIEQGRLRAWIDQVDRLIYFEGRSHVDDDAQGTAGGLGVEKVEKPIQGITLTERWDERIKDSSMKIEAIVNLITSKGLLNKEEKMVTE